MARNARMIYIQYIISYIIFNFIFQMKLKKVEKVRCYNS